jgi:phage terminase large subunit GpA-like protein
MGANELWAVQVSDGAACAYNAIAAALMPLPQLGVREWSDAHRRLPSKGASEPGPWRTARVPFLGEIMDCLSDTHSSKRVVFIKSAQVGGTECGLNWVGWHIGTRMAPMLCVQPTLDMAERWSKQRLAPMIEDAPSLRAKVAPSRARDSGNTTLLKEYPGGVLIIAGANSASGLRSMPAARVFLDEVDAYPIELEGEGDPIKLAEARAATFPRRKIFLCSTPTIESLSRIWREWEASDQRRYHVACPHCGGFQVLEWDNLRSTNGTALYYCSACGVGIEEHHKTAMLAGGVWIATHPERPVPGFHISALYTPIGLGLTWAELLVEGEEAAKDKVKWKTFENTKLGRVSKDPTEKLDEKELQERAERYDLRTIPAGIYFLTGSVDVQKDRLECLMLGLGPHGAMAVIDSHIIPGDPTESAVWEQLEVWRTTPIANRFGVPMRITALAVDSGYLQEHVLRYTRPRQRMGVIAVKGASVGGRPIISRPSKVDYTWGGQVIKDGAEQWQVGGDTAKTHIFAWLAGDRGRLAHERKVRFSDQLSEAWFAQLTAEIYDPNKRRWIKIRERNEALDLFGYAIAAAYQPAVRLNTWRDIEWQRWRKACEPDADLFTAPAAAQPESTTAPAPEQANEPAEQKPAIDHMARIHAARKLARANAHG